MILKGGQAIDRTGVRLGLSFPCGKELERLASESKHKNKSQKASVDGLYCSLSGIEKSVYEAYRRELFGG